MIYTVCREYDCGWPDHGRGARATCRHAKNAWKEPWIDPKAIDKLGVGVRSVDGTWHLLKEPLAADQHPPKRFDWLVTDADDVLRVGRYADHG
jgi:hypothetical protein